MLKRTNKKEQPSISSDGGTAISTKRPRKPRRSQFSRWFWHWFAAGEGEGSPGYTYYIDWGLTVDAIFGVGLMYLSPIPLAEAARTFLLPVVGIMIGIAFAWVANANAILHTPEIEGVTRKLRGGLVGVVWEFQLAVLLLLTILVLWGLASLQIFDVTWPTPDRVTLYSVMEIVLYGSASCAVRVCWRIVRDVQNLFVTRHRVREVERMRRESDADPDESQSR